MRENRYNYIQTAIIITIYRVEEENRFGGDGKMRGGGAGRLSVGVLQQQLAYIIRASTTNA